MRFLPHGWRRAFGVWGHGPEREVDAELAFHLDERTTELIATGLSTEAARSQARAEFGDIASVRSGLVAIDERISRHRSRAERWAWVAQDIRYVVRSLRRSPAFVITVSLTLALGLGANAAIFSLLDRLFLRSPAGVVNSERVHRVYRVDPASMSRRASQGDKPRTGAEFSSLFSHDDFAQLQKTAHPGTKLAGYTMNLRKLGRGDDAVEMRAQYVVGDFFGALGVQPLRGRVFQGDEQKIESPTPVLVISNALWNGHFGGRVDIVGTQVDLNFRRYTIIGVASADFRGPDNDAADLWAPMNTMDGPRSGALWYTNNGTAWLRILANTGDRAATSDLEHAATLAFRQSTFSPDSLATGQAAPLVEAAMPGFGDKQVAIATRLAGVAVIVLLIACANVANLFLARGMRRRREIAMRLALGVTRGRLVALLLMESLVVSLIGATIALVVAIWGGTALRAQVVPRNHWVGAAVDVRVLLFTVALAMLTGILAGLVPALRSSRPDLSDTLKSSMRDGVFQRSHIRSALLVAQTALSVVLLAGAGLFIRSLHGVETENIGYDTDRVVFAEARVDPDRAERGTEIPERLPVIAERLRGLPGVEGTAMARMTPMQGMSWVRAFRSNGDSLPRIGGELPLTSWVSPDFFATMGMHIISGRGFTPQDKADGGLALVVNETMARNYWPARAAIGNCVIIDAPTNRCIPIVGVVSNAHFDGIVEKPSMQFYLPLADTGRSRRAGVIMLRTAIGSAPQVAARVRQELRAEFAGWASTNVHTMADDMAPELQPWRTGAALFTAAGLLALLVAIIGVYSTISYTFSQRTHEIGIRVALGARASNVVRLVVGEGVGVVLIGVVIGVGLALAGARVVGSMLYHISPRDPAVLATVSVVLIAIAAGACLVPAWRALRIDPAMALRAE